MTMTRRILLQTSMAASMVATLPAWAKGTVMRAYDIVPQHRSVAAGNDLGDGWVFGLPPGITTAQWPLDPNNGYPLMHGFTLRLPEDYRIHGKDIVALSFFATPADHNDGVPTVVKAVRALMREPGDEPPPDPMLLPFWNSIQDSHPRLHRMRDILGLEYAVILLRQEEFSGGFAQAPRLDDNPYLAQARRPKWLDMGAARALWLWSPSDDPARHIAMPYLGGEPPEDIAFNRALRLVPREHDPNAGKVPGDEAGGYQSPFFFDGKPSRSTYREHKWVETLAPNHLGGTMRSSQDIPPMSPFYIEFDEQLGNYNFGGGNAQLDFKAMSFDWAQ